MATIELHDVRHAFGGNPVLRGVSIEWDAGEVLALMGANGAGKSTLIKVLAGVHPLQHGRISVDGASPDPADGPQAARRLGIETVHQRIDEGVVPGLSVAENLLFERIAQGDLPAVGSLRRLLPAAREVAAGLGLDWSDAVLRGDVHELGIADQQLVLLARALSRRPKLLVLDEPTSALSGAETERLFGVIDDMRRGGVAVLYVSHRIGEIERLADRIAVLRDGSIRSEQTRPYDWQAAVRDMLGERGARELAEVHDRRGDEVALELRGVRLFAGAAPFDLELRRGEVTGVVGLLGAGKSELAMGVFGAEPFAAGTMRLGDEPYAPTSPAAAVAREVYLVPEDRAAQAMLPGWSIARTASLPFLRALSPRGVLRRGEERADGRDVIDRFDVVASSEDQGVDALSGGNQQKVVVGRWLRGQPRVMLLDEPFRGIDIGARHDLSRRVRELAAGGSAVVVLAADVDEVLEVADRVVVLAEGVPRLDARTAGVSRDLIVARMAALDGEDVA
ncbi:sugar ABC transporter ATP-binding protein [Pseudonocardia humida]|uniref:Sugar ABC transporter ATP-binding protein n=1 Tax=Pseudonocardia humida TaxID=2800819 RepID=A0ABT0ZXJ6_9PSEU|nr:ATP-binding cassette domain-containing protein [Pseudonocardia humida]MCO1655465.1 sugar ABC transporter ATP-binding protein [Pseudonocardia humida]